MIPNRAAGARLITTHDDINNSTTYNVERTNGLYSTFGDVSFHGKPIHANEEERCEKCALREEDDE